MPKNDRACQALLLRGCGRGGRAAGGPVASDVLGVLLLNQLPERVDALEQRVPGLRHLPLLRAPATAVDVRDDVLPRSGIRNLTLDVMIGMLAVSASRASFSSSSPFAELMQIELLRVVPHLEF